MSKAQRNTSESSIDFIAPNEEKGNSFDDFLREKWEEAEKKGIFLYTLNIRDRKILDGRYKYLAQLNIDRGFKRRSPENIRSMTEPFDQRKFNFTKLPSEEILMELNSNDKETVIAVNVSPIEYCHCLLLPQRSDRLPQIITKYSLYKAFEIFSSSSSLDIRVAFNSLCANASVNHLHWHVYYLKQRMLLEYIDLEEFAGPVQVLRNYPSKGFCIKYSRVKNIDNLVNWAFAIIDYLQNARIAHNVYITRAKNNSQEKYTDLRIYIWARKASIGVKDASTFVSAVCELFGHLSIKCEETYESLTEEYVARVFTDLTEETFASVFVELRELIESLIGASNTQPSTLV